ncbi:LysR substrate-binding domain-containing protein [Nocardioidaceae bacterium SCSIO 66511]|nr:LysR substrate-binding domain-containing protein [Nocardioidaceae bacterium SCSIO 66511]
MDIGQLRDFIAVLDSGSLTKAAASLHVSQPAISQRMAQLESELGVRLLERGPRGIEATPAGRELYRDAQQVVRQFDRLGTGVRAPGGIRGPVAVGLPSTVAVHLAPALYSWTKRHHPGVHLQLFESMSGYIQELLQRGRMDLAVLYSDDASARPTQTPLYAEELYLFGDPGSRLAAASEIAVRDLQEVSIVAPGDRSNLRALIDRAFSAHGMTPRIVADVESLGAMIRIAESGDACAVLPLSSLGHRFAGTAEVRRIVEPVLERYVAVCAAAEFYEPRAAVDAVRRGIVEVTRSLAEKGDWQGIRLI